MSAEIPDRSTSLPASPTGALTRLALWRPAAWVAALVVMAPLLYVQAWSGGALDVALPQAEFLSLHTLLEVVAVVVSMSVGLTASCVLNQRRRAMSRALGAAFIAVAVLDLLHLLSFAGMPHFVSENTPHKSIVLWLLARLLGAVALIAWCFPRAAQGVGAHAAARAVLAGVALSLVLGVLAVFRPELFPHTFVPGQGLTTLKLAAEGAIMALLAVALGVQLLRMAAMPPPRRADHAPLCDALLLMLLGECFFVIYGDRITSATNLLGHVYKVLAYGCLYRVMFLQRVKRPYLRLEQARLEIEQRGAEYRALLELAPVGVVVINPQGEIQLANRALESMFGWGAGELQGRPVDLLLPAHLHERHAHHRADWANGDDAADRRLASVPGQRKDGTLLDVEVSVTRTQMAGGMRMTACVSDVSHRRAHQAELEHRATHDMLTGLPNRWRFVEALRQAIAQAAGQAGGTAAVAMMNCVGFKQVNERHGGSAADMLLKALADRLVATLPASCFVARLGGDVFGVIAPQLAPAELARQLAQALAPGVRCGTLEWPVAAAMGLADCPAHAQDADLLLRCADLALHESKRLGRGQTTLYDAALGERARQALRVHARLQAALREDALSLHFQPQVDVASGQVHGFEALLRWTDAELGVVPPGVFIPVAEDTGLIGALGEAVLRMACRQMRQWQDEGFTARVAINLSPREFLHPGLVARIAQELQRHGVPAQRLSVEVTESAVIDDFATVAEQLQALVELGVEVHLDDFGTGHSSLAWLKAFPITAIKIDRSFVRDMAQDASDEAIVRAVIGLGHTLGCSIVAEGVEKPEQLQRLRELGCEAYQGWLFSPALPAPQAAALLQR
ncbi:bifunctional diguanylate cyclase/phosphodiesterase [Azohydromonas lata]|uniref:bifunctional diguanylate cyclase/phosphodiesterase n=1 Tax=Azohydromonas lata TaxID=45677 RepID=UPI00082B592F|nr:EAL domain-containing protein [Azohydromonas lata]